MCLTPFYRAHKNRLGNDTEIFRLPDNLRRKAVEAVRLRYRFLPYLWHLAWEAHLSGRPIVRALPLEFPDDENTYSIDDEYLVGPYILFAPIITPQTENRLVYLPKAGWFDYWSGDVFDGGSWIRSGSDMPLYVREGSAVPLEDGLMIFGEGSWRIYHGDQGAAMDVSLKDNTVRCGGEPMRVSKLILLGVSVSRAVVDGEARDAVCRDNRCVVDINNTFREVKLE
jgi:alpha-glucosidase